MVISTKNMRQCSKKYLTSGGLSTIYNEHMIKTEDGHAMIDIVVSMAWDLNKEVRRAAPDNGGQGR